MVKFLYKRISWLVIEFQLTNNARRNRHEMLIIAASSSSVFVKKNASLNSMISDSNNNFMKINYDVYHVIEILVR